MKSLSLEQRLDAVVEKALAEQRIVGTAVRVLQNGSPVYERAAGYQDREVRKPMRPDSIFRLASVTKPIVSAAALALIDRGRLHLSDPVTRWLPAFRPRLPDGTTPTITIHHLLTHTSGLNYGFEEPANGPYHRAGVSDGLDAPERSLEENLKRLASVPLLFRPGTRWNYSLSTDVLGAVLASVTGKPLPQVVADLMTRPLGMKDTDFRVTDRSRLATPYADGRPRPVRMTEDYTVHFGAGAGVHFVPSRAFSAHAYPSGGAGMVGTAADIARFLEALRRGRLPGLKPPTIAAAMQDQVPHLKANTQGPGWGFGYGWAVLNDPRPTATPQRAGTIAWGGVYGHSWFVDPKERWTVVALTNTAIEGMSGAFPRQIRDAVYGRG